MTINYYYDRRYTNRYGEHRIMISVNIGTKHIYLPTGISITEKYWNDKKDIRKPIKGTYPDAERLNQKLYNLLIYYQTLIEDKKPQSVEEVSEIVNAPKEKKKETFSSFFISFMVGLNPRTKELYQNTYQKAHSFSSSTTIQFSEVNYEWLCGFDKYLQDLGNSINTRSRNLRDIRAVLNQAMKCDIISYNDYPFRKFKIQSANKEKEYLSLDLFKKLVEYMPAKQMEKTAKDMWLLSFFLCGANPIDLWNMTPAANDIVSFQRMKIKFREPYTIKLKITECAKKILERYSISNEYLIDLRNFSHYDSFYTVVRHSLKDVGIAIGFPKLKYYHARYTFATYAHQLGFNDSIIGHALGHSEDTTTAKFYVTFDWSQVWELQDKLCLFIQDNTN